MRRIIAILCLTLMATPVVGEPLSNEACEKLLTMAEEKTIKDIYDDCGFDDEIKAWNTWAPFAAAHNMKHALFELCKRYPNHHYGEMYCEKAVELNFGPALSYMGHQNFRAGKTDVALDYFNKALKAGDLPSDEILKITELLGMFYLKEGTPKYAPRSGVALLSKAASQHSAVANNLLGYLVYSGKHGVKKDPQKALEFIWRAILFGCPAAEENLGAFHLARQGKISEDDAAYYMSLQASTCQPFDKNAWSDRGVDGCDCVDVRDQETYFRSQPYLYIEFGDKIILENRDGHQFSVAQGDVLPDGLVIQDVKPTLVTLTQGNKQVLLNRYHTGRCVSLCLANDERAVRQPVGIRPYRLTFTKQECADIAYYANRLIDTTKPYVGKKECLGPEMDETTKLLLKMN